MNRQSRTSGRRHRRVGLALSGASQLNGNPGFLVNPCPQVKFARGADVGRSRKWRARGPKPRRATENFRGMATDYLWTLARMPSDHLPDWLGDSEAKQHKTSWSRRRGNGTGRYGAFLVISGGVI